MNTARPIAIAVVQQGDHFLVGRRREQTALAGYYEFPGGKIEAGESPAAAAVRECLEETGILVDAIGLLLETRHDYQHDHVHLHFYACRPTRTSTVPRPPFQWVSRSGLQHLEFPEANQAVLEQLR